MQPAGFALFDTAIGACGIAWGTQGIVGVQLPEGGEGATRERMQRRFAQWPERELPVELMPAVEGIRALLNGLRPTMSDTGP